MRREAKYSLLRVTTGTAFPAKLPAIVGSPRWCSSSEPVAASPAGYFPPVVTHTGERTSCERFFWHCCCFSGLAAAAQAADLSSDGPPPTRFARLQNLLAPPADATYSLGGYAPADPNIDPNADHEPGIIDKSECASPPGGCGWAGGCNCGMDTWLVLAITGIIGACGCGHKWGNCGVYGGTCGGGCGCDTGCNTGCGCGGGYGFGGPAISLRAAAAVAVPARAVLRFAVSVIIVRCFTSVANCCDDVATTCDSCGCGATADSTDSTPTAPPEPGNFGTGSSRSDTDSGSGPGSFGLTSAACWRSMAGMFGN